VSKLKQFVTIASLIAAPLLAAPVGAATVTFASAAMGPTPQGSGLPLSSNVYIGWRFKTTTGLAVTQVGGHLGGISGNLFAAIVPLTAIDALPSGAPFDTGATIPHTAFTAPSTSADIRIPLSTQLAPGNFALVVGSGQFDANGTGWAPISQQPNIDPTTPSTYIAWRQTLPGKFAWTTGSINNVRLVVIGSPVAGPSDFNQDGRIDGQDLAAWKLSFNSTAVTPKADANGDNHVDGLDFLAWQRAQSPTPAFSASVPEPAGGLLTVAAGLLLLPGLQRRIG
jgi:hypothetical protein